VRKQVDQGRCLATPRVAIPVKLVSYESILVNLVFVRALSRQFCFEGCRLTKLTIANPDATIAMILCIQREFTIPFMPPTKTTCTAANAVLAA
jgi:hypothetical protein